MGDTEHYSRNGFLTSKGYLEVAQQTSLEGLAPRGVADYIDSRVSVSASDGDGDLFADVCDQFLDEQYRRFHNGS